MENIDKEKLIRKILDPTVLNIDFKKNEVRLKSGRKAWGLSPVGIRNLLIENLKEFSSIWGFPSEEVSPYFAVEKEIKPQFKKVVDSLKEKKNTAGVDGESLKIIQHIKTNLIKLVFKEARSEKDRIVIFDKSTNKIETHFDVKMIEDTFHDVFLDKELARNEFRNWSRDTEKYCRHTFNQKLEKLIPVDPGLKKWDFNNYSIPEYRYIKDPQIEGYMKTLITSYFKHLIPCPHQRKYTLSWIYTSLTSRQQIFLCLVGAHGVGKTLFMDLVSNLHGRENTARPKDLKTQFNNYLFAKSIVLHDEVTIGEKEKESFKRIANEIIQIEKKGEDQRDVMNTASIIIATNYYYNIAVEPNDRRFSMVDLGTVKLEVALGKRNTSKLFKMVENPHFLHFFRNYLLEMFDGKECVSTYGEFSPTTPLTNTRTFEICCRLTARDEIKFVLDCMREKNNEGNYRYDEVTVEDLISRYKKDQKMQGNSYKRLNKYSVLYQPDVFADTMSGYLIDGKPIIELSKDKTTVFNLLAKRNVDLSEETKMIEGARKLLEKKETPKKEVKNGNGSKQAGTRKKDTENKLGDDVWGAPSNNYKHGKPGKQSYPTH